MDYTWSTPSNFNDFTDNEAFRCEAQVLQEILRINELMRKRASLRDENLQRSPKASPENPTTDPSDCSEEVFNENAHEIYYQVTSNSVSCLQERNVTSSTSMVKKCSRMTLKRMAARNDRFPESDTCSEKDTAFPEPAGSTRDGCCNENPEIDEKFETLDRSRWDDQVRLFAENEENGGPSEATRDVEEGNVEDAHFGYPFEVVELYSSKRGKNVETDPREARGHANREANSVKGFPKEGEQRKVLCEEQSTSSSGIELSKVKEAVTADVNVTESTQANGEFNFQRKHARESDTVDAQNRVPEDTVVKSSGDQQDRVVIPRNENRKRMGEDRTTRSSARNGSEETFASISRKTEVENGTTLITIFEATEKVDAEEELKKEGRKSEAEEIEMSEDSRNCKVKENDRLPPDESNVESSKLQKSCTRKGKTNLEDVASAKNETRDLSTIERENNKEELKSLDSVSTPQEVTRNNDFCVGEGLYPSKFDEFANNLLIQKRRKDVSVIREEEEEEEKEEEEDVDVTLFLQEPSANDENRRFRANGNRDSPSRSKRTDDVVFIKMEENRGTECTKDNLIIDLSSTSDSNTLNQLSINSSEISKATLQSNGFTVSNDSNSDLLSVEKKLKFESENLNAKSPKEKGIKIVIEKRDNNNYDYSSEVSSNCDTNATCNDKSGSSNVRPLLVNDKKEKRQDLYDDSDDTKHKVATQESRRINVNYEDTNICKILTKIHMRLNCYWLRIEQLQLKLQGSVSMDSTNSMMISQLLNKTTARCKSYIHGSNDSFAAELEITKLLSKYIDELVRIVNRNEITLADQERRVNQMQLELLQGHRVTKKRNIFNEIILTSNYLTNKITCLIETISCLVKNVMIENEEKENVRNPRKHKTMQRRMVNNLSTNDSKQRTTQVGAKSTKSTLVKKKSSVETQMSVISNSMNALKQSRSKTSAKALQPSKSLRKEQHPEEAHVGVIDKKLVPRQKYRVLNHQQPVWRPGGAVKLPSSNSATTLTHNQKHCTLMHGKERGNSVNAKYISLLKSGESKTSAHKQGKLMDYNYLAKKNYMNVEKTSDDNGKRVKKVCHVVEENCERKINELKKKSCYKLHSSKSIVSNVNNDHLKITGKRSNTSLKTSPRRKLRSESSRPGSKSSDYSYQKSYENASLCNAGDQKILKGSNVLCRLEENIKIVPDNRKNEGPDFIQSYQLDNEASSVPFNQLYDPVLIKGDMKINEEKPTRVIDSNEYQENELKMNDTCQNDQIMEKLSEKSSVSIMSNNFIPDSTESVEDENVKDAEVNGNFENYQSETRSNLLLDETNASSNINFSSSSVCTDKLEALKPCRTSFNSASSSITSYQEQMNEKASKNNVSQDRFVDRNEKQQQLNVQEPKIINNQSIIKKDKSKGNSHAASLSMLKGFLYDQGINIHLVNRAERYLKDKQKARKYLKKKCISFADMPLRVVKNQRFETRIKSERCSKEKSAENIENSEKDSVNNKNYLKEASSQFSPKRRDIATNTIQNSNNAYSQTTIHCKISKNLQTIPEDKLLAITTLKTTDTQTEEEGLNPCLMSNVRDNSTETVKICSASKSVTANCTSDSTKNDFRMYSDNYFSQSVEVPKTASVKFTKVKIDKNDEGLVKECTYVLQKLLNEMHEKCDESLTNYNQNDVSDELCSVESSATSFDCLGVSTESSENCAGDENTIKRESQSPIKVVSSEIIAALQVAAIRARNVYRAIDIYKRKLKNNFKKQSKRSKRIKKIYKACKERSKSMSGSSSVIKIAMQKKNNTKGEIIKVCKDLRQAEVTLALNKSCLDFYNRSEEESFTSAGTSSISGLSSKTNIESTVLENSKKSSSSAVLIDVKSVVESLLNETSDVKFETIEWFKKMSNSNECVKFYGNTETGTMIKKEQSPDLFSRENVSSLVVGIMCIMVFWCLHFTITCDVIS